MLARTLLRRPLVSPGTLGIRYGAMSPTRRNASALRDLDRSTAHPRSVKARLEMLEKQIEEDRARLSPRLDLAHARSVKVRLEMLEKQVEEDRRSKADRSGSLEARVQRLEDDVVGLSPRPLEARVPRLKDRAVGLDSRPFEEAMKAIRCNRFWCTLAGVAFIGSALATSYVQNHR
ncbi:hypothetical protein CONLIGDRAFT_298560 [Coniochaeta ligniaria NRRL 30616]|uniref:Uncharacterized protein n=1 Tax=Coniochaeta ligniaria NRRL 30616 TaxID=1408157 RepID=A0A1J7IV41_9PEZI|nr:hypothetical protein CONLIGDRAFT_298560 [Coniochaeta ligniaria NRRL 30616]